MNRPTGEIVAFGHTRGSDPSNGPDYCVECSEEVCAWVKWPCKVGTLEALVTELGLHLTALCDHPENWADRYNLPAGRPCPGCYDARDKFASWAEHSGSIGEQS